MEVKTIDEIIKLYKEGISLNELKVEHLENELFEYAQNHQEEDDDIFCLYADCLRFGIGTEQNIDEAVKIYIKLSKKGHLAAQSILGDCYYVDLGVPQDSEQAVYWYRKSAEQGYARAQFNLGFCYYVGQGVPQDYEQAVNWYRKSAEQGDASAQYNLGVCYRNGQGVPQDDEQGVYWYRKSAEQGDAAAQCNLGFCYRNGLGVPQDYEQAVYWYRKSAEQGDAAAQCNLGFCYRNGQGVPQDYEQARYYLELAADQNIKDAFKQLSTLYSISTTTFYDFDKSLFYDNLANDCSRAIAYYNVGLTLYLDENISHNKRYRYGRALKYITKAYELGLEYTKELKDKIEEEYSKASLATVRVDSKYKELHIGKSKDVFISWNNRDLDIKNKLRGYIENLFFSCWDSDIDCHGDIRTACQIGVLDSSLFIVIISGNALESKYIPEEIQIMLDRISVTPYLNLQKCIKPIFINRYVTKKGKIKKVDVCKQIEKLAKKEPKNPFVILANNFGSSFSKSIDELDFEGIKEFINEGLQALKIKEYKETYLENMSVFEGALENTLLSENIAAGAFSTTFKFEDAYIEQSLYKGGEPVDSNDILHSTQPILIYGEGGIGKSLYLKNLTRKNFLDNSFFFYLSSKEILKTNPKNFYDVLYTTFESYLRREVHVDCIKTILEHASCNTIYIVIDALDEINDVDKQGILEMILKFRNIYKGIHYIFSSRNSEDANVVSNRLGIETIAYALKGFSLEDTSKLYDNILSKAKCNKNKDKFLNVLKSLDNSIKNNSLIISNLIIIYLMTGKLPTKFYDIVESIISIVFENLEKDRDPNFEYKEYFQKHNYLFIQILEYIAYMRAKTDTTSTTELLQFFFARHEDFKEDRLIARSVGKYFKRRGILKQGNLNHQIYRDYFSSAYHYNHMYQQDGNDQVRYLRCLNNEFTLQNLFDNLNSYGKEWYGIILFFILKIDYICHKLGQNNPTNEQILSEIFNLCLNNEKIKNSLLDYKKNNQIYHSKLLENAFNKKI